jgi:hypothetical protein
MPICRVCHPIRALTIPNRATAGGIVSSALRPPRSKAGYAPITQTTNTYSYYYINVNQICIEINYGLSTAQEARQLQADGLEVRRCEESAGGAAEAKGISFMITLLKPYWNLEQFRAETAIQTHQPFERPPEGRTYI